MEKKDFDKGLSQIRRLRYLAWLKHPLPPLKFARNFKTKMGNNLPGDLVNDGSVRNRLRHAVNGRAPLITAFGVGQALGSDVTDIRNKLVSDA